MLPRQQRKAVEAANQAAQQQVHQRQNESDNGLSAQEYSRLAELQKQRAHLEMRQLQVGDLQFCTSPMHAEVTLGDAASISTNVKTVTCGFLWPSTFCAAVHIPLVLVPLVLNARSTS